MLENTKKCWLALFIALAVFFVGIFGAKAMDTLGGKVKVQDIYFTSSIDTSLQHGRIYIPETATAENPAPCLIWIPGNDTDIERCAMFGIEYARRGFVVYLSDIRNQGMSEGDNCKTAGDSNGAIEATEFVRSLSCVDKENIAIGGHSLGGMDAVYACQQHPDWYECVYGFGIASTCTNLGDIDVDVWGITDRDEGNNDVSNWSKNAKFYSYGGTSEEFEPGKVYGSFNGPQRARCNYQAWDSIHATCYFNKGVHESCINFIQQSCDAPNPIDGSNQIYNWRYLFTTISAFAIVFMLIPLGTILLETPFFKTICRPVPEFKGLKEKKAWWPMAVLAMIVGPATYLWTSTPGDKWLPKKIFYIRRVTLTLSWNLIVAGFTVILLVVGFFLLRKKKGHEGLNWESYGLGYESKKDTIVNILKSLLLAFVMILSIYALIALTFRWTLIEPRVWNFSLRVLNWVRVTRCMTYFLPFAFAFVVQAANLHGMLRPNGGKLSVFWEIVINIIILAPLYYIWAIWLGPYKYLHTHLTKPAFAGFLYTFIWGVPLMNGIVATLSTYFFRKTGRVWLASFLAAFIDCWVLLGVISLYVS